uniref:Venom polypeptide n=1 Tax=Dolopus genitalis TaxID=2488630 RepID=A0A3G5BIG3_DOLGE|nr:venom polypeptide [Dolopus genitalis]
MEFFYVLLLVFTAVFAYPTEGNLNFPFIVGGDPAEEGQFPFQVGVQTHKQNENGEEYKSWCGGSLISDQVVLTAAHCVVGGISTEIFLGASHLGKGKPMKINVGKEGMIFHEDYRGMNNDIAVVILPSKITFSAKIQLVNLPRRSQQNNTFEKSIGWISGWGMMGDDKGSTEQLQFTRRWILPHDYCHYYFPGTFRPETQVCVDGSHAISACRGDSGGPLTIVEEDETRTLVGLTSYGKYTCAKGFPAVYARVTPYLDWIHEKTGITIRE